MGVFRATVSRKAPNFSRTLKQAIELGVYDGIDNGGRTMEKAAKQNVNNGHTVSGTLANSIRFSFGTTSGTNITAFIRPGQMIQAYTLEYGATGVTHGSPWYVHESQTPYDLSSMYGFDVEKTPNGRYYKIYRLKPHYYLRTAFAYTKYTVVMDVANSVKTTLGWCAI